jgi:hypothetical protein
MPSQNGENAENNRQIGAQDSRARLPYIRPKWRAIRAPRTDGVEKPVIPDEL